MDGVGILFMTAGGHAQVTDGDTVKLGNREWQARHTAEGLGGPPMILYMIQDAVRKGIMIALWFMCFLNVNLAILNLMPIPVLDGGHLMFCGIEAVRRRPPSLRTREIANVVGLALLLMLMVLVFKNDILRYVLG